MEEKSDFLTDFAARFPGAVVEASAPLGDATVVIRPESLPGVASELQKGPGDFAVLLDLTCVDRPDRPDRFELVYHFFSLSARRRLRLKIRLPGKDPEAASLTALWKNADWLEREVFDMFGVRFAGHPELRRLFMNEEFEGHPLRKDYPLRKRQPVIPLRTP
jgi:NADH-quinone oxidoreductase subunit C